MAARRAVNVDSQVCTRYNRSVFMQIFGTLTAYGTGSVSLTGAVMQPLTHFSPRDINHNLGWGMVSQANPARAML